MAAVALVFLVLGAFVPLGNLLLRRSLRLRKGETLGVLALALVVVMTWTAAISLAATKAEARECSERWFGWSALWKSGAVGLVVGGSVELGAWFKRGSSERVLQRAQATVAAWITLACTDRAVWLLAGSEGWAVRAGMAVLCACLSLGLLSADLFQRWCERHPVAALGLQHSLEDVRNALTMRTSAALEEEKARSCVRESKLGSRVLELLSVISRKDELLLAQVLLPQQPQPSSSKTAFWHFGDGGADAASLRVPGTGAADDGNVATERAGLTMRSVA